MEKYDWKSGGYYGGDYVTPAGEVIPLQDFYRPHEPVYVPGFGPDDPTPKGLTRQEFKDECDINVIMKQYEGAWPPPPTEPQPYMDLSFVPGSLLEAHEFIAAAEHAFVERVPAQQRYEMFKNSAFEFVEFASDPKNIDQLRKWNLAPPAPEMITGAIEEPLATPVAEGSK